MWPGGEKGGSKAGESGKASNLAPKWKWVLRIGFLKVKIDNKYQKAKIKNLEWRLDFKKYNIKKKKKNSQKLFKKYVYEVCFKKKGVFFLQSNNRL